MRVKVSPAAVGLVRERGGKVYVRAHRHRCCGGALTLLDTSPEPGEDLSFTRFESDGIEVYLDARLTPPAELELAVSGFRCRDLRAYWNGCAYVA
jgi:hypothetical protein